jgi:peptidase E
VESIECLPKEGTPAVSTIKPIFLLADSQLLFHRDEGVSFLERVRKAIEEEEPGKPIRAAYIGASNGDAPEFYDLFKAAMGEIGVTATRMIPSELSEDDLEALGQAELILLAGGDTRRGWEVFQANGLQQKIIERYYGGALLMGVSAGAVQLGLKGMDDKGLFDTFRLVPFVIDAHDEPNWTGLTQAIPRAGEHARGFGIPTGGGAVYHPDYSMEPVRHPVVEVSMTEEGQVRQALLFPGETTEAEPQERGTFSPEVQALLQEASAGSGGSPLTPPDDDESVN